MHSPTCSICAPAMITSSQGTKTPLGKCRICFWLYPRCFQLLSSVIPLMLARSESGFHVSRLTHEVHSSEFPFTISHRSVESPILTHTLRLFEVCSAQQHRSCPHCQRAVGAPFLGVCKARLHGVLGNLSQQGAASPQQGDGPLRSLPTQSLCDSLTLRSKWFLWVGWQISTIPQQLLQGQGSPFPICPHTGWAPASFQHSLVLTQRTHLTKEAPHGTGICH